MGAYIVTKALPTTVPFVADASANTTLTSMAAAEDYFGSSARYVTRLDLSAFSSGRLILRKQATPGAAGAIVLVKYSFTNPLAAWNAPDWSAIPNLQVSLNAANTVLDSGWVPLPLAALLPNTYLGLAMSGGDGVASPVCGNCHLYLQ